MRLGGIQKNSFIDYPGKISCVLFLTGCNFDCPYCHNPQLVKGGGECPCSAGEIGVYDFLQARKGFLDGVVISGGEPTLQDDLPTLCERVKDLGYPVKLDTNGSRPRVIQELIQNNLVDYLAMDIKTDPLNYASLAKGSLDPADICESIRIIMESGLPYEFKTTCVKPLVSGRIIESICHFIRGARLYALQRFQNSGVLHPEFFEDEKPLFSEEELMRFKSIAAVWVKECILR
jgi:pyruvate formate lyase activating enzyme